MLKAVTLFVCFILATSTSHVQAQWKKRQPCCPQTPCPQAITGDDVSPENANRAETSPTAPSQTEAPLMEEALTGEYDVAAAPNLTAPNMIGDFFGGSSITFGIIDQSGIVFDNNGNVVAVTDQISGSSVAMSPGTGGGVGRVKLAENSSILPRDRVFITSQFFDRVPISPRGTDVTRFTPGCEKTFFDGMTSVEVRVPFAGTIASQQDALNLGSNDVELGNVTLFLKALFYQDDTFAAGGGVSVTTPTASDSRLFESGREILRVENEGCHIAPYFGMIWSPGRLFTQAYLQYDVDATGRAAYFYDPLTDGLVRSGKINDTSVFFADFNAGYWIYQSSGQDAWLTGIAPVIELHINKALGNGDFVAGPIDILADVADTYRIVDMTLGSHFVFNERTTVTLAAGFPLRDGANRQFDYEFSLLFNHYFGAGTRLRSLPPIGY